MQTKTIEILKKAIELGVDYVDVDSSKAYSIKEVIKNMCNNLGDAYGLFLTQLGKEGNPYGGQGAKNTPVAYYVIEGKGGQGTIKLEKCRNWGIKSYAGMMGTEYPYSLFNSFYEIDQAESENLELVGDLNLTDSVQGLYSDRLKTE